MLPLKATLFVPSNDALSVFPDATAAGVSIDPSILAYHITPQHLSFSDLKKLPVYSRIPTLLTSNFIIVTNASSRFSIDDAEVTHPDLYISPAFSVHGVSKILDYKAYGGINITFTEEDVDDSEMGEVDNKKPNDGNYTPFLSGFGNYSSGVEVSSASDIAMIFLVLGIFLFSKIE
ncbi:hypothetical protein LIER_01032 [Lithospermum erythrorhizon]|uniref:FAS1 domain-containing protein n=1 Tax=Lithospermum erythrorhizon TaxID=34254 RepID=A0AAV3NP18_LITER